MEVAGVVLSGIPIVLYALDNYQRAWNPAKDFWQWGNTIASIRMNVFLQKQQLDTTLANLDLHDPTMAELEDTLRARYPEKYDMFMLIIKEMEKNVADLMEMLDIDAKGKPKWSELSPDRVKWEWRRVRRSFGRKERKEIIDQLQMWNSALQSCFEKPEIPSSQDDRMVEMTRARFDERKCAAIRANAQIIHNAFESGLGCSCGHAHKSNVELNWHHNTQMAPTTFSIAFSFTAVDQSNKPEGNETWRSLSAQLERIADTQPHGILSSQQLPCLQQLSRPQPLPANPKTTTANQSGESKRKRVVQFFGISSGKEKGNTTGPSLNASVPPHHSSSVKPVTSPSSKLSSLQYIKLCSVLNAATSSPPSFGYLSLPDPDQRQHVHVLQVENSKRKPQRTISLRSLLARTTTNKKLALSRKQRFGIAAALAWAVLHLCDSAWLGKQVDDESVQLFLEKEIKSTIETLSVNPYLCFSFRPNSPRPQSPQQPEKFESKQIANMTLFTLAIRLMELGMNRPFGQIRQEHSNRRLGGNANNPPGANTLNASNANHPPAASTIDDFKVAMDQLDDLYLDCGTSYAYAVQRCLKLEFPGPGYTKSFEHRSFRQDFFSGVVAPLQATYDITPGSCSPADL